MIPGMSPHLLTASLLLSAYLLGSVSGSLLLGRLRGVDIRQHGSGNAGGTNAFRTLGWKFALAVAALALGKSVDATTPGADIVIEAARPRGLRQLGSRWTRPRMATWPRPPRSWAMSGRSGTASAAARARPPRLAACWCCGHWRSRRCCWRGSWC